MTTKSLHVEIDLLKTQVIAMGNLAIDMVNNAVESILIQNVELANSVIKKKEKLKQMDSKIEQKALKVLTLYQPMAIDMRRLACIFKLITYLARIGMFGKDIAKIMKKYLSELKVSLTMVNLNHILEHVSNMINLALEAFEKEDVSLIEDFGKLEDEVDALTRSIFRENITYMMEEPKYISLCSNYILISQHLETCGDLACKMAEKINYMVSGKHAEIP